MKIKVERQPSAFGATIGELFIDTVPECFTLEDEIREIEGQPVEAWKVKGETAIGRGTYPVVITFSTRFQRELPLLQNVAGFDGIRLHPGNTSKDTEGCILVGKSHTDRTVTESRAAFAALFTKIQQALNDGDTVSIEII